MTSPAPDSGGAGPLFYVPTLALFPHAHLPVGAHATFASSKVAGWDSPAHISFAGDRRGLGTVRKKMLDVCLPAVLADVDNDGILMPGSTLKPTP